MSTWKRKLEEYEANLFSARQPASFLERLQRLFEAAETGEIEWKRYDDGSTVLEVKFLRLKVPDGAAVEVWVEGQRVGQAPARGGYGREVFTAGPGEALPAVGNGSPAELRYQGQVLARGTFRPD